MSDVSEDYDFQLVATDQNGLTVFYTSKPEKVGFGGCAKQFKPTCLSRMSKLTVGFRTPNKDKQSNQTSFVWNYSLLGWLVGIRCTKAKLLLAGEVL